MAMERDQHKFRVLMFPWLAHGHIFPFLELSKKLSRTSNFTIYLCSTAVNLDSIRASLEKDESNSAASVVLVELHMPSSPELPPELHTTKNLPLNLIPSLIRAFQTSCSSLSEIMDSLKPDLLIYDFFQPWAPKLASSKGIHSVYFLTSSATSFSYYHHGYTMGTGSTFPYKAISQPASDRIRLSDFIRANLQGADNDFAFGLFTRSTDIVLVKSCSEIELKYIEYLSALCKKKMVCTGPLIVDGYDCNDSESLEIMKWLSGKDHCSTLYISFGSELLPSKEQIAEIAKGLQLSGVNFLWIIRFSVGEKTTAIEEVLPEGFLEMVKDRGLVVSRWAPQTKILGHPSIGGFMIHLPQHEIDRMTNRIVPNIKQVDHDSEFGMLNRSTYIVLVKSCRVVEEKYLDYLSVSCKKETVCTGPLISGANKRDDSEGAEIMKWLSGKNHGSTVYISFGSECFLSKKQISEIAKGLHLCEANFLWVIRFPAGETDIKIEDELGEGFVETVKERGLVVRGWAPQTKILGHPSIGGFVSHCGWSSIMESIYYGVPVIGMPMKSDQPLNAQLVVEVGVGVEVERGGDCNGMYVGEEVAKAINKVLMENDVLRKSVSEAIREKEGEEVDEVAEKLSMICMKNKKQE